MEALSGQLEFSIKFIFVQNFEIQENEDSACEAMSMRLLDYSTYLYRWYVA
jgi:hypothetical protein